MAMAERAPFPALISDIGATHVRFALVDRDGAPQHVAVLTCSDYPDLLSAVRDYLVATPAGDQVTRGVFDIACPVKGDRIHMTNLGWAFSIDELRRQLGFDSLHFLNDFAAVAYAVPYLSPHERHQIGGGAAQDGAPAGVVGPGTGLGVSALIPARGGAVALETEGGHVTLAAANEHEARVIDILRKRFGHVSAERAISGPGLVNLYEALAALDGQTPERLKPEHISARGIADPDSLCGQALQMFCAMLGTVAGDLALSLGAHGGIYITGGIIAKLGDAFEHSNFRQRFEDKGRFSPYLADVPTYVITHPYPALVGLAGRVVTAKIEDAYAAPSPP